MDDDEFHSMTLGDFNRRANGHIRNTWETQRIIIAGLYGKKPDEIMSFGEPDKPPPPTKQNREYMQKRHENTLKILNGRR